MEDPNLAYEDMLFFERRLTEVISGMQPKVRKWRIILLALLLSTGYSAYYWLSDPVLRFISLWESLMRHPMFTTCIVLLLIFFVFFGVHKRVVAPKIIAMRCRHVLADFCLSCDEHGKLIVRPAHTPSAVSPPTTAAALNFVAPSTSRSPPQLPVSVASSSSSSRHNHSFGGGSGFDLVEEDSLLELESPTDNSSSNEPNLFF